MTEFALYIRKENGLPYQTPPYVGDDVEPALSVTPPDCELIIINNTNKDYDLLYAMLIEDPNSIAADYLPYQIGGLKYDFENKTFIFEKAVPFDLAGAVRQERDRLLKQTDDLALVPDYPGDLHDQIVQYRAALRDLPKNLNSKWKTLEDVVWPERPAHI